MFQFKVDKIRGTIDQKRENTEAFISHRYFWLKLARLFKITKLIVELSKLDDFQKAVSGIE